MSLSNLITFWCVGICSLCIPLVQVTYLIFLVSCSNFLDNMPFSELKALNVQAQSLGFSSDDVGKFILEQKAIGKYVLKSGR